ncbi:hypothetical protein F4803DRAFT_550567 [Xylaria telfairii]|nr:hypothetical protein F4803DRAFT_550567 [Xylaria telfairii]
MASSNHTSLFTCLSAIGFGLMWGVMSLNGGSEAMFKTAWTGVFPDGTLLGMKHSGIWPLDFQLNTLVAFFSSVVDSRDVDVGPYLMVLDLTTTILVINMMVLVNSRRHIGFWLRSATLWICLCNCFGTAVFFPIWSLLYINQRNGGTSRPLLQSDAWALQATALLSILLELPLLAPAWAGAGPDSIQKGVLVFFLVLPVSSCFQTLASWALTAPAPKRSGPVKIPYYITGVFSSLVHIYTIAYALMSPEISLGRVFVPHHAFVMRGSPKLLTEAAHLFLQYDYIIVAITVLLVGSIILRNKPKVNRASSGSVLTLLGLTCIFGPGAGLAYAAYYGEDHY